MHVIQKVNKINFGGEVKHFQIAIFVLIKKHIFQKERMNRNENETIMYRSIFFWIWKCKKRLILSKNFVEQKKEVIAS